MRKIRVLVVDDSVVVRRMLTDILNADPAIEVVGAAADGAIALAKIPILHPDVITLDVEMPGMSGLDVLAEITRTHTGIPVVMFSASTERAAATTLEALARGAADYVTKPTHTGSREAAAEHVRTQLVPKVRALAPRDARPSPTPAIRRIARAPVESATAAPQILAIGASTGGPNALSALAAGLPLSPVPIVVAQHMPPVFTRLFAERLSGCGPNRFREAVDGQVLEAGKGYVAPGDFHLRVVRDGTVLRGVLDQGPAENSVRPAVDVLFRSVAETFGGASLAVVLTGMGQDGFRGCEALRKLGAQIIAQDEASSVVWGMPGIVARAHLADAVLPIDRIAAEIVRRTTSRGARRVG